MILSYHDIIGRCQWSTTLGLLSSRISQIITSVIIWFKIKLISFQLFYWMHTVLNYLLTWLLGIIDCKIMQWIMNKSTPLFVSIGTCSLTDTLTDTPAFFILLSCWSYTRAVKFSWSPGPWLRHINNTGVKLCVMLLFCPFPNALILLRDISTLVYNLYIIYVALLL